MTSAEFNLNQKDIRFKENHTKIEFPIHDGLAIWLLDNDDDQEYRITIEMVKK